MDRRCRVMKSAAECTTKAIEMDERAERPMDAISRNYFLEMAQCWRSLAIDAAWQDQLAVGPLKSG